MAIKINWRIISEKERKKSLNQKMKPKKKVSSNIITTWSKIFFVSRDLKLFVWKVIDDLWDDELITEVVDQNVNTSYDVQIIKKRRKDLRIVK